MTPTLAYMLREGALAHLKGARPEAYVYAMEPQTHQDGTQSVFLVMTPHKDYRGERFCYAEYKIEPDADHTALSAEVEGSSRELLALFDEHHGVPVG